METPKNINKGHLIQSMEGQIRTLESMIIKIRRDMIYLEELCGNGSIPELKIDQEKYIKEDQGKISKILETYKIKSYEDYKIWLDHPRRGPHFFADLISFRCSKKYNFRECDNLVCQIFNGKKKK